MQSCRGVRSLLKLNDKKFAFTLAEILIVLVVLGIISLFTLTTIIGTYLEKSRISAIKKSYAELNQAIHMASANHSTQPCNYATTKDLIKNVFIPTLKITKKWENGFQSSEGITYLFQEQNTGSSCKSTANSNKLPSDACWIIVVDVNGIKKAPNKPTETATRNHINDTFILLLYDDNVVAGKSPTGEVVLGEISNKVKTSYEFTLIGTIPSFSKDYLQSALGKEI